jgi:hypothetical protein
MTMGTADIFSLVEEFLARRQPSGYHLNIIREASKQEDDWWYVVVQPDHENVRAFDYAGILAETEQDLQDEKHLNVLLVPTLPS